MFAWESLDHCVKELVTVGGLKCNELKSVTNLTVKDCCTLGHWRRRGNLWSVLLPLVSYILSIFMDLVELNRVQIMNETGNEMLLQHRRVLQFTLEILCDCISLVLKMDTILKVNQVQLYRLCSPSFHLKIKLCEDLKVCFLENRLYNQWKKNPCFNKSSDTENWVETLKKHL